MDYTKFIRDIPDWPTEGVMFKDITPLLADKDAFRSAIEEMAAPFKDAGITKVMGAEARGFLFGTAVAYVLNAGFVPARKPGKLPSKTISADYELEYGLNTLEVHEDSFTKDDVVLIIDDVMATGGTACAKAELVDTLGAQVAGYAFVLELEFLHGRDKLDAELPIVSLVKVK